MGGDDAQHILALLRQIADVGHDEIDARRVAFAPEQHAAIDDDPLPVIARAKAIGVEIHADLARPAQRQEDQFVAACIAVHQSFDVAGVDQHQPAHGEIGIDMVDGRDVGTEQMRQPAGRHHRHGLAIFRLDARRSGRRSGRHSPNRRPTAWRARCPCRSPSGRGGWRRAAAAPRPGAAPRWKDWRRARSRCRRKRRPRATMSKLVAVPKSTTITAPLIALMRRHGVAQPVGADRLGPVDIGLDAQIQRRIADQQRLAS